MRKPNTFIVGVLVCSACVPLTRAGGEVRVGKAVPNPQCVELGMVYGSSTVGAGPWSTAEMKLRDAQNDIRNRTAELGGNFVVMDVSVGDQTTMSISGRAFKCPTGAAPARTLSPASPTPRVTTNVTSQPVTYQVGCAKDTDCKGDRICDAGHCISPKPIITPVAPQPVITPVTPVAALPTETKCSQCSNKCASARTGCNQGNVGACYQLGACLCQCKLDAGGCGTSLGELTQCIAVNREKAAQKGDGR